MPNCVVRPGAAAERSRQRLGERDARRPRPRVDVEARLAEQDVAHGAADEVDPSTVRDRRHGVEHGPQPVERLQLQIVSHVRAQPASAIASISTFAPDGSAETSIVARAGGVRRRGARRPRSSRRSRRGRSGRRSSSRGGRGRCPPPRGSRRRFANTCSVCSPIPSPTISAWSGRSASCPETNTKPVRPGSPASTARPGTARAPPRCERRPCSISPPSGRVRQLCARATPSALKIASSTCSGSLPSISRTCRVSPAPSASSSRNVATMSLAEAGDARVAEVDVRDDQRPARTPRRRRARAPRRRGRPPSRGAGALCSNARLRAPRPARAPPPRSRPPRRRARPRARGRRRRTRRAAPSRWSRTRQPGGDARLARSRATSTRACSRPASSA